MAFSKARRLSDFIAADGTIPTAKFASSSITSSHLVDGTIAHADLHTDMDLTGKTVLVANASTGDSDTTAANTAFVQQEIAALVDSSPGTLNTLNELAAALGDDANFSTTVTNSIATKLPLAGGTMTGLLTAGAKLKITDLGNATVAALQLGNSGLGISSPSTDQMNFITADTTRMVIGTTATTLQSGVFVIKNAATDSNGLRIFQDTSDAAKIYNHYEGTLQLGVGNTTALTIDSSENTTFAGNINLTGGGTIEAPSVGGGETLTLKAAGGITTIIDSNGNSGDDQFFKVQKHTNTDLFTVKETGNVEIPNGSLKVINSGTDAYFFEGVRSGGNVTLRMYDNSNNLYIDSYTNMNFRANQNGGAGGTFTLTGGNVGIGAVPTLPLDVSAEIAASIGQTSTYNYANNRNWAMRTNNYGSSNWGGWSLEQSTSNGGTPSVARIGVHMNGNVGINMGGDASSGLTSINPATALHVGGDITVGSADAVGTGGTASIRFQNDNERSRITSNYASGGGGQMGFWTDTAGGTLLQRAYIKNDGEFNLQHGLRLNGYTWTNSDVLKAYRIDGPGSSTLTRTINVSTYWGFPAQGGAFMYMLHGWQSDSAIGMVHWSNAGNNTQVIVNVYHNELVKTGLTSITVAKGSGNYDIDITLAGTHSNTHGWYWKVWA